MSKILKRICVGAALVAFAGLAQAQAPRSEPPLQPDPTTLDEAAPPGANYDKAEFRFWAPDGAGKLDGILVLNPGSNGEGRQMASDPVWRQWAASHKLAVIGTHFTDKVPSFVEDYADVSKGSGQALLNAINKFAKRSKHPELAKAPLVLWGMSAGGEVNYEIAAWKPERVAAFIVNKGNFYYTGTASKAMRGVPALLFVGNDDLQYRVTAVTGTARLSRSSSAREGPSRPSSRRMSGWFASIRVSRSLAPCSITASNPARRIGSAASALPLSANRQPMPSRSRSALARPTMRLTWP